MAIKIGIIGMGGMTAHHYNGFRAAGAEVVALADINPAKEKNSQRLGIPKFYNSPYASAKSGKPVEINF